MTQFIFDHYAFDRTTGLAEFHYAFDDGHHFVEKVRFTVTDGYHSDVLERALFLAWILAGTSYYKCFPTHQVRFKSGAIDEWQAEFLNAVYQEGLGQFAYENNLKRENLAQFRATTAEESSPLAYEGRGVLALQSGGKDSLLVATLLEGAHETFASFYISSTTSAPALLSEIGEKQYITTRTIDIEALKAAQQAGGLNGHVPVTYIVLSYGIIQAILSGQQTILVSIGHEGEEPHAMIGDLPINHQWSKTWPAEQLFVEYVARYVSSDIRVGSPIRSMSELRVSELFAKKAWGRFSTKFSSCNRANYGQGTDNTHLTWCGDCPKCANAFLLFAPFVEYDALTRLFGGKDLFTAPGLIETYKGLLGVDGVMKPFECIGEIDELRYAYHASRAHGYSELPFTVPASDFDLSRSYPGQSWAQELIQSAL